MGARQLMGGARRRRGEEEDDAQVDEFADEDEQAMESAGPSMPPQASGF